MKQIIPLFPESIESFFDVFGGGLNVGINVPCKNVKYNDACSQLVDLLKNFYINDAVSIDKKIKNIIDVYSLDRTKRYQKNNIKIIIKN